MAANALYRDSREIGDMNKSIVETLTCQYLGLSIRDELTSEDAGRAKDEFSFSNLRAKRNILLLALNLFLRSHVDKCDGDGGG